MKKRTTDKTITYKEYETVLTHYLDYIMWEKVIACYIITILACYYRIACSEVQSIILV